MLIWLLLIFFVAALVWSYFHFKKDFFHPSVIFCAAYTFSLLCTIYNIKAWSVNLGWQAFSIILLGAIEFLSINTGITYFFNHRINSPTEQHYSDKNQITVAKWKIWCFICFDSIVMAIICYEVIQIATQVNATESISEILGAYRLHTSYQSDYTLSALTRHLTKFMTVGAYIFLFIAINNFIYSNKTLNVRVKSTVLLAVPVIIHVIRCLATSDRGSILQIITAGIIMTVMIWYNKENWQKRINIKRIFTLSALIIITLALFFFSATLLGRNTASRNMVGYITLYAGGSIENLDLFFKDENSPKPAIYGEETFGNLISDFKKYGLIKSEIKATEHLEHRFTNGVTTGNVYTSYRQWYNDFGYIGIILLQAGCAIFFAIFYNFFYFYRHTQHKMTYNLLLIFYAYMMYTLVCHPITSFFYNSFVAIGFITLIIIAITEYYFLIATHESNSIIAKNITTLKTKIQEKLHSQTR